MEECKRIRVVFKDDDILSETQKLEGLDRSWFLLKPQKEHITISDVASHLLYAFHLHQSCPNGLLLYISGFVLPQFELTGILKDNEVIRVRKRRNVLSVEGNNAANDLEKLEAVERRSLNTGTLLLANEEFEEENRGYESDDTDEESKEEVQENLLLGVADPSSGNADFNNCKRNAPEKLQGSKKKKQRSGVPANVANDDGISKKQKRHSRKKRKTDSSSEDNGENNEESAEIREKTDVFVLAVKRSAEVQENSKDTDDAKIAPKETKKGPSRSARRKHAKRRWLREMAKIKKTASESEGLRKWNEDHAQAERNKYDQSKEPKWKIHTADMEKTEVNGQPKGLLHRTQSPQNDPLDKGKLRQQQNRNAYFHKGPNQNGEAENLRHDQSNQDGSIHERTNKGNTSVHEQPNKENGDAFEQSNQNGDASEQSNQESVEENEVVPIVIRPGHIRFEPLEKEQAVRKIHGPSWNGITSKKKGQKWGMEKYSFSPRINYKNSNEESSELLSNGKEKQRGGVIDLDKLPPLPSTPKVGDLIAYRVLELSSSWTPELSAYRVGKVSYYNAISNKTILVPVSDYPIVSKTNEDEGGQLDSSLYKEDGSLEIDFSSLTDVRVLKHGNSLPVNGVSSQVNVVPAHKENAPKTVFPVSNSKHGLESNAVVETGDSSHGKEMHPLAAENGEVELWDEISEVLNAMNEELTKECGLDKNANNVKPSPVNSSGKNVKSGLQPLQENSGFKQSSGGKSWSYRLRGSALGPTMNMLRSKKET